MPVSQVDLLLLAEALKAVIAPASGALLVLPDTVEDAEAREEEDSDLAAQVDGVAGEVLGGVGTDVGPAAAENVSK